MFLTNSITVNVLSVSPQYFERLKDKELLLHYRKSRHETILSVLFERYKHLILGVCLKYFEDHDTCQETMIQVFELAFRRMETESISNFKNWLYTITRNKCIRASRAESNIVSIEDSEYFNHNNHTYELNIDEFEEIDNHLGGFDREKFYEAFELLKKPQRDCIFGFYFEKKTYREIAETSNYNIKEVKSNIQNGKRKLKKALIRLFNMDEDQDF